MTCSHSTTFGEKITREAAARIRQMDGFCRTWLDHDRHFAGKTELIDCSECATGIAERVATDYSSDLGAEYEAVNGSLVVDGEWYCAACAVRVKAAA